MPPHIRYLVMIAALLLVWIGIHLSSREPIESEPRLVAGSLVRQVLDLQTSPPGISGTADGNPIVIPANPQRYLIVSLADGQIAIGWSPDPTVAPAESAYVPTTGACVMSWVAKEDQNVIMVKASTAITSDIIVTAIELRLQH